MDSSLASSSKVSIRIPFMYCLKLPEAVIMRVVCLKVPRACNIDITSGYNYMKKTPAQYTAVVFVPPLMVPIESVLDTKAHTSLNGR